MLYLEETRQQSRLTKFLTLRQSLASLDRSSQTFEQLQALRRQLSTVSEHDLLRLTRLGKDIITVSIEMILCVVHQIGQTNVQTPTLESMIAYIRSLIHNRSAHMRQSLPGYLLISWYELSDLLTSLRNEPELRITKRKVRQLIDVADDTAAWAYKHLTSSHSHGEEVGFIDRSSIPYTNE